MRTLLVIMMATMLVGCSGSPDVSDFTPEQLAALQVLGEMMDPDSGCARYSAARERLYARGRVYVDAMNSCEYGTDEYREASAKELSFAKAENNLWLEHSRRREVDGADKAADWYVAETKKSDEQIVEKWHTPKGEQP